MLVFRTWLDSLRRISHNLQLTSLQTRLTLGVAACTALGLGGSVFWASWRMEQILIQTHKQNIEYIAGRFPADVVRFQESDNIRSGLQPATNFLSMGNVLLWVKDPDDQLLAAVSSVNIVACDVIPSIIQGV